MRDEPFNRVASCCSRSARYHGRYPLRLSLEGRTARLRGDHPRTLKNTHAQGSTTLRDGTPLNASLTYVNYRSAITQAETIYFNTGFNSSNPGARLVAKQSNFVSYQDTIQVKGWSWS